FLLLWAVAAWAGWATMRRHQALAALLPAGILLAANTFFGGTEYYWLLLYLLALVTLMVRLRQATLEKGWESEGIDYSPEFRLELYFSGVALASAMAFLVIVTPNPRIGFVTNAFWRVFADPYTSFEKALKGFFPEPDRVPRSLVGGGLAGGETLPRAHLLGGSPELQERAIMQVSLEEPFADPALRANIRWRGVTYSLYNGRGWANPAGLAVERFDPGQIWLPQLPVARRTVRQQVSFIKETPFWLYALADPLSADRPYRVHLRGEADAAGLEVRQRTYTVISDIPNVSEEALRKVQIPPDPALAAYLTLPDSVPERVRALAREVAGSAPNAYEQAKALEAYLRAYPYSLDVPEPPEGVDVADYFLFDLRKGYCDYYATAMVVMARSLGLPARLAVGYAAGDYDAETNSFFVVEADAHSWPEIYFGEYGWIPFEPTAAQPVYVRVPLSTTAPAPAEVPELDTQLEQLRRRAWLLYGYWRWGALLFVVMVALGGLWMWFQDLRLRRSAQNPWQHVYLRLERWGARLGVPPAPWYTPTEYAALWQQHLLGSANGAEARAAVRHIRALTQALELRAYAPPAAQPRDRQAYRLWRDLRRVLWRLRIASFLAPVSATSRWPRH
ncbi:MAG: hypothetical protein D6775_09655, partial [Caldilineae bacterium]